jgi:ABC-type branched-subunit amino acid transport system ATPase component
VSDGDRVLLATEGLSVAFGGLLALAQADLSAGQGLITALIGPNGAGKTTAVNAVTGVYRPTTGRIFFQGLDITAWKPHRIRRLGLTRTFQNLQVFQNMTVLENVMVGLHFSLGPAGADQSFPARLRAGLGGPDYEFIWALLRLPGVGSQERLIRERALATLEFFGLADKADWASSALSYGDMKRTEMARALVGEPTLVLLDEPVAGLNAAETDEVAELILKTRDLGVSVLLIEHDMNMVMGISDRVMVLNHGQLIAEGTPAEMQAHPEVIAAYLGEED